MLLAIQHVAAGIERGKHAAGHTMQIVVELALHATQTIVVGAYVAQDLGRELAVGIEAFEFLLEIDALEVQRLHPRDLRRVKFARNPGEVSRRIQPRRNLMGGSEAIGGVGVHHLRQGVATAFACFASDPGGQQFPKARRTPSRPDTVMASSCRLRS